MEQKSAKKNWTALIVDDERLAREKLRSMLGVWASKIEVVGEAANAEAALELTAKLKPDLLFLDVQMPGASGFELVERLAEPVRIIFVTAFDRYAIRAFEVNAFDYLLKPIESERLAQTVARLGEPSAAAIPEKAVSLAYDDLLFVNSGKHLRFVRVGAIKLVRAAGVYSEIFFADGSRTLINKSLNNLIDRLPEKYFLRIHRSVIVNVEYVERVEPWFNHSFRVFLAGFPEPFAASRRFAARMRDLMI